MGWLKGRISRLERNRLGPDRGCPHSAFILGHSRDECLSVLRPLPDGEALAARYLEAVAPEEDAAMPRPDGRFQSWDEWRVFLHQMLTCDARNELAHRLLPFIADAMAERYGTTTD